MQTPTSPSALPSDSPVVEDSYSTVPLLLRGLGSGIVNILCLAGLGKVIWTPGKRSVEEHSSGDTVRGHYDLSAISEPVENL